MEPAMCRPTKQAISHAPQRIRRRRRRAVRAGAAGGWAAPGAMRLAVCMLALVLCAATVAQRARAAVPPPPAPAAHAAAPVSAAAAAPAGSSPAATPTVTSARVDESAETLNFLGHAIDWYRGLATEDHFATQPAEMLYLGDDRQLALETVQLAFEYARARAELIKAQAQERRLAGSLAAGAAAAAPAAGAGGALPGLAALMAKEGQAEDELRKAQVQADQLKAAIAASRGQQRLQLTRRLGIVQSQVELNQARVDSFNSFIDFDKTASAGLSKSAGLSPQIDALERSIAQLAEPAGKEPAAPARARSAGAGPAQRGGLLGAIEAMLHLGRERDALGDRMSETRRFAGMVDAARTPLVTALQSLNERANELAAQGGAGDLDAVRRRKQEFDALIRRHKLIVGALMPLAKQLVVLQLYSTNLERWDTVVKQRSGTQLRELIARLVVLGLLLVMVFGAAIAWRTLTFRYIQDLRRRRQLLQVRKVVVAALVALVLVFNFATELGTLATVMGLAAAGVAVALQNVILSFAGYFFVTGRYGIRVGDRVQVAGVNGDVVELGLFKMALMELSGDGGTNQPTGRVVVFPNSIVFQPNGNFFRQAPGTNFVWNEFRLTLAPDCDYRLAEKRLLEVVEDVYARYRDTVQRQYRELERDLNLRLESPRPQSRLRLGQSGIDMTIRYPADTRHAVQVSDEISRRVLDAIAHDPALTLAVPGTPNLLPLTPPAAEAEEQHAAAKDAPNGGASASPAPTPAAVVADKR